jgi:hypothetical protein
VLQDVRVDQVGFTQYEGTDDQYVSWAVLLENPNPDKAALDVTMTVRLMAADGSVLGEEVETIPVLMPGTTAWAREQPPTGVNTGEYSLLLNMRPVTKVDVAVEPAEWRSVPAAGGYHVSDERVGIETAAFPLEVTATVTSEFGFDQTDVPVVAVLRDDAGRIVGGARWRIGSLPAGGTAEAVVRSYESIGSVAQVADVELHLSPPSLG